MSIFNLEKPEVYEIGHNKENGEHDNGLRLKQNSTVLPWTFSKTDIIICLQGGTRNAPYNSMKYALAIWRDYFQACNNTSHANIGLGLLSFGDDWWKKKSYENGVWEWPKAE